jgi:hypothetical protein
MSLLKLYKLTVRPFFQKSDRLNRIEFQLIKATSQSKYCNILLIENNLTIIKNKIVIKHWKMLKKNLKKTLTQEDLMIFQFKKNLLSNHVMSM